MSGWLGTVAYNVEWHAFTKSVSGWTKVQWNTCQEQRHEAGNWEHQQTTRGIRAGQWNLFYDGKSRILHCVTRYLRAWSSLSVRRHAIASGIRIFTSSTSWIIHVCTTHSEYNTSDPCLTTGSCPCRWCSASSVTWQHVSRRWMSSGARSTLQKWVWTTSRHLWSIHMKCCWPYP